MQLNDFLFPAPKFEYYFASNYIEELILIPKKSPNDKVETEKDPYIPCLLIRPPFLPQAHPFKNSNSHNILIFFHAHGEDIFSSRILAFKISQKLHINVLIVEYPGYSLYLSSKSSDTILSDSLLVYDYIKQKCCINDNNIFVLGRSIGTSPAIYLSSNRNPGFLFVISAFTSIRAVAQNVVGFLKVFLHERFTSIKYIKDVKCPILFIHGLKDPIIPYTESQKLKKECKTPFELVINEEMTHNDFIPEIDIIAPIEEFIGKHKGYGVKDEQTFDFSLLYDKLPEFILKKINYA